jgi:sporulation protein YlmC with PRC-barrel domain
VFAGKGFTHMKDYIRILGTLFLTLAVVGGFVALSVQSHAQENIATAALVETLSTLNRNKPLQNPSYQADSRLLSRSILDQKNKVVGQVQDIIMDNTGAIEALEINFNRLRLGTAYLNYRDMRFTQTSQGYQIGLDTPQLRSLFPEFPKAMPTEPQQGDMVFRLSRLSGAPIKLENNNTLGKVVAVLFNRAGTRAEALFIEVKYKPGTPDTLAIPYAAPHYMIDAVDNVELLLSPEQETAIIEYLNAR